MKVISKSTDMLQRKGTIFFSIGVLGNSPPPRAQLIKSFFSNFPFFHTSHASLTPLGNALQYVETTENICCLFSTPANAFKRLLVCIKDLSTTVNCPSTLINDCYHLKTSTNNASLLLDISDFRKYRKKRREEKRGWRISL